MDEILVDRPGRRLVIKADTPELALTEAVFGAGEDGTSPHFHKLHSDSFYVLEGTLRVTIAGEDRDLGPGEYTFVPPGVVHCFNNVSDEPVRFLNLHTPACGFVDYLRALMRGDDASATDFDIHDA